MSRGAGLLALAALALAGCKGEEALFARPPDAAALSGLGGTGAGNGGTGNGGKGGAGMAGQAGSAQTGGVGGTGNKGGSGGMAGGGAGGKGGNGTGGAAGAAGQPAGKFGDHCQNNGDCQQGTCKSGFCCNVDCSGTCQTCDSTGATCTNVGFQQDPRNDCAMTPMNGCGANGTGCNGNGACILWSASTQCASAKMCSGTGAVIEGSVCDGQGHCNANAPTSCGGYLCQSNACLTSCTDGTACVTGGFCGAGSCVGTTPNLAGNGNAEYGTTDGWSPVVGGSVAATSAAANSGTYSIEETGRTVGYQGPGYYIPTGLGQYNISFWAMQNQYAAEDPDASAPAPPTGLLQLRLNCQNTNYYLGFSQAPMPQGVWVNFSLNIDTSDYTSPNSTGFDCFPNGVSGSLPGAVRSAILFLNEVGGDTRLPNFYIDDLVVTVTDGHNLVGNPNFEAGLVDGWGTNTASVGVGGSASLSVSSTQANTGGKKSLSVSGRTVWNAGIRYPMPIGAADYAATFYVMQNGATTHALQLVAVYNCLGDSVTSIRQKTVATTSPLPTGQWTPLSVSAVAFPPSDAPKGCKMTSAAFWVTQVEQGACGTGTGQIECPDLFLDDATITLTNAAPTD